jgi:hypothetical protein
MSILKFSRAPKETFDGTNVPAGMRLAIPADPMVTGTPETRCRHV